jgi:uncharacterized cupin superfamily protein
MKVESSQSGGEYGAVLWTVRAGEEPPLHIHSREDELLYVVQGQLIARVDVQRRLLPRPHRPQDSTIFASGLAALHFHLDARAPARCHRLTAVRRRENRLLD